MDYRLDGVSVLGLGTAVTTQQVLVSYQSTGLRTPIGDGCSRLPMAELAANH